MRKLLINTASVLMLFSLKAQIQTETVSLGAGYANQTWYSLQNGELGSAPKNNWDIAFDVAGFGTSIHINSASGTILWTYPTADTSGWATLDTTGINSWSPKYNSDTTWTIGAFDKGENTSISNDVGWGVYNQITHTVTGDSLFVIKLSNGVYKKLRIVTLSGGTYHFKYSDLNGNNLQTHPLLKSSYSGKNFGYFSIQNNTALNREPVASANWDLLFTQYTAFIPSPYTVAGVLSNKGVKVAQADNVSNPATYNNWSSQTSTSRINEIGYDWKAFAGSWQLVQDTVYFVQSQTGDIWKIKFTGFGGSGNGNYIFTKEKLSAVGIIGSGTLSAFSIIIYPNPSNGENPTLIYNFENNFSKAEYIIYDLTGKAIQTEKLKTGIGLFSHTINTASLSNGLYSISVTVDHNTIQQKLIIK